MRMRARQAAILGTLLLVSVPQAASAGVKQEARKHFDRGVELVDDGQLAEAVVEFQRSYELTHHFAVLYNIGQVYVSLAKPVEAVDAFTRYLTDGGIKIKAARRLEVEQEIARQKARIATVEIRGLPDGTTVRLDGKEIGKAPITAPLLVGVGTHTLAAAAEGYEPTEQTIDVAGEDHKVVKWVLVKRVVEAAVPVWAAPVEKAMESTPAGAAAYPAPGTAADSDTSVEAAAKTQPMSKLRIAGIATASAGVLGMGAGVICWYLAKNRHSEALTAWNKNDNDNALELQSESLDYVRGANVSYAVGGGLVALGVVLFILGTPSTPAPAGHAHVLPTVGPGFAGLTAGGIW